MLRVDTHCIDHPIHANASRRRHDCFNGILCVEVENVGAERARAVESVLKAVNRDHASGAHLKCARNGELSHRPGSKDS
jgi:hypothetical protein